MELTVTGEVTTNSSKGTESSQFNELYLVSAILAFFAVIGTAGNAIVIYVFNRQKNKSVSTFFILTLAFIDFGMCLFIIPFVIFMINVHLEIRCDFICKAGNFLLETNLLFSAFVMVAIAIDRYFGICHPFKRVMTVCKAKVLVVCMAVIASAIGVCLSLTIGVYNVEYEEVGYFENGETFGSTEGSKESTTGIYPSEIDVNSSGVDLFLKHSTARFNPLSDPTETSYAELRYTIIYTGYCLLNDLILSWEVQLGIYYLNSVLYLFCFVVVLVLYILIYRSVLLQRKIRRHLQMEMHLALARATNTSVTANCHSSWTWRVKMSLSCCLSTTMNPSSDDDVLDSSSSRNTRPSRSNDGSNTVPAESAAARAASLKTAAMLFVVTIVFALSCLPTILMQYHLIPYNKTAFHMFFVNNVANPIIYSFMDRNFRGKVKNLIFRR